MSKIVTVFGAFGLCTFVLVLTCQAFARWLDQVDMLDEHERQDYFSGIRDINGLAVFDGDCEWRKPAQ